MTCADCRRDDLPTGVGAFKIRDGVLRCRACNWASIGVAFVEHSRVKNGEKREPQPIVQAFATAVATVEKKVRVPQVCANCGYVEGPNATRADQVFERYGRLLCRLCRKRNRDGVRRRRGRKGG